MDKENQQPMPPGPPGIHDLQNNAALTINPGYMSFGSLHSPQQRYNGAPVQSTMPGSGGFYPDTYYNQGHPGVPPMHIMPFQQPVHGQPPAMIDPKLWAPVANVVSPEKVQEMFQKIATLQHLHDEQEEKIRQRDEADQIRYQWLDEFQKTQSALEQHAEKRSGKNPRNNDLARAMHSVMNDLLYLEGMPEQGKVKRLPHPLQEGEQPRQAPDGSRVWNPEWGKGATQCSTNCQYIDAAIALVKDREARSARPSIEPTVLQNKRMLQKAARSYYTTLSKRYKAEASEEARANRVKALEGTKFRNRKKAKTKVMRDALVLAEARHGPEKIVGLLEIIHTDWMSSERSDCGKMDPNEFKRHREQQIGSNKGWEVRKLAWRAKRLVRIYLYLQKLRRDEEASIAGSLHKKKVVVVRTPRFMCAPVNVNDGVPALIHQTKARPFQSCISQSWLRRTGNEVLVQPTPTNFTVFDLEIPDEMLDDDDLAYLATYEDDD